MIKIINSLNTYIKNDLVKNICLFAITFMVQSFLIVYMQIPYITDEYGTIANAAFLSGYSNWSDAYSSSLSSYWGYGLSIFYIPVFLLFGKSKDMILIYHAMLFVNASFISTIPIIVRKIWIMINKKESFYSYLVYIIVALFPSNVVLSKCAWNETMLIFLTWMIGFVGIKILQEKHIKLNSFILGFLLVFSYATHGRGLVIGIAILTTIVIISIANRHSYLNYLIFLLAFILFYICHKQVNVYLCANLLEGTETARNTFSQFVSSRNIFSLISINNIIKLIKGFLGLFYYDYIVTLGLIFIFLVIFCRTLIKFIRKIFSKKNFTCKANGFLTIELLTIYAGLLLIGNLFVCTYSFSTIYITNISKRREYFVYGRYTESGLSLIIFIVLFFLPHMIEKTKIFLGVIICSCFMTFYTIYILTPLLQIQGKKTLSYTMCSGLFPFTGIEILSQQVEKELIFAAILMIHIQIIIYLLYRNQRKIVALVAIGVVFLYSSIYSMVNFLWISSSNTYELTTELTDSFTKNSFINVSDRIYLVDYDKRVLSVQYMLPEYNVIYLNKKSNGYRKFEDIQYNSFIVCQTDEKLDLYVDDCCLCVALNGYYIFYYGNLEYFRTYATELFENRETIFEDVGNGIIDTNNMADINKFHKYQSISEISAFEPDRLIYEVADTDTRDRFSYNLNCLKTQKSVFINTNGVLTISNIPISSGNYCIEIHGKMSADFHYTIVDSSDTQLNFQQKKDEDITYLYFNSKNKMDNIGVIITANETEEMIYYIDKFLIY